jgi:hypothetical protein
MRQRKDLSAEKALLRKNASRNLAAKSLTGDASEL